MKPPIRALLAVVAVLVVVIVASRFDPEATKRGDRASDGTRSGAAEESSASQRDSGEESRSGDGDELRGRLRGRFAHDRGSLVLYSGHSLVVARDLEAGPFDLAYAPDVGASHRAVFVAPGFRPRTYALPDAKMDLGEVSLLQSTGYGGRLVSASGAAVDGIVVEFRDRSLRLLGASAPSDRDGRFRVDLETPLPLMAMHPGANYLGSCRLSLRAGSEYLGSVVADPSGLSHTHEVRVADRERSPRIRVLFAGKPVAGAVITSHAQASPRNTDLGPSVGRSVTDAQGEAALAWPKMLHSLLLVIRSGDDARETFTLAMRDALTDPVHEIDLAQARELTARIVWAEDSSPVAGAALTLSGHVGAEGEDGQRVVVMARTDAEGVVRPQFVPFVQGATAAFELQNWAVRYSRDGAPRVEVHEAHGQGLRGPALPDLKVGAPRRMPRLGVWLALVDSAGAPQVPRRIRLWMLEGKEPSHMLAFHVPDLPVDGAWYLSPLGSRLNFLDRPFDSAVFCVEVSGRQWQSIEVEWSRVREAWTSDRVLTLTTRDPGATVRLQLRTPAGRPAAHALVRLMPSKPYPYERDSVVRVAADSEGNVVVPDLDRQREYAAFAIDPATHAMALRTGIHPDGGVVPLQLAAAREVVIRAAFDDGESVAKPRAVSLQGWARMKPNGLFHPMTGNWQADGGLQFPPMVPEIFEFDIQAFDRKHADSHRMSSSTHRMVVSGAELPGSSPLALEFIKPK